MRKNICVLEDNRAILDVIELILEDENYNVHGFGTVASFLASFKNYNPALCLLDVMLPDGSGLDVCKSIKESRDTAHLPVMIMTANTQFEQMKKNCPAEDFIAKPFDIINFAGKINQLVAQV